MRGAGGVIGFELAGTLDDGVNFINATNLFSLAVSLGDAESLI
jgi:methionine-gamma-lyase